MTSSKFGVERETFHKEDYENCPILRWAEIKAEHQREIKQIALLIAKGTEPWEEVDNIVGKIFHLTKADKQLIADALEYSLPYKAKKDGANAKPDDKEINSFLDTLTNLFQPFVGENSLKICRVRGFSSKSFEFFKVSFEHEYTANSTAEQLANISEILSTPLSASLIRIKLDSNKWLVGQLSQRRYWSKTRARLMALEWLDSGFLSNRES